MEKVATVRNVNDAHHWTWLHAPVDRPGESGRRARHRRDSRGLGRRRDAARHGGRYCRDEYDVGHNERLVASALAQWKGDRTRITVATKGGIRRPNGAC